MAAYPYTVIKTDKQYNKYCNIHEEIVMSGKKNEREEELELLYLLISKWDDDHSTLGDSEIDPIEIIKYLLEENNMKAKDLAELLELTKGTISKILNYKKGLSKRSIRILSERFKMRQEAFNKPYALQQAKTHTAADKKSEYE